MTNGKLIDARVSRETYPIPPIAVRTRYPLTEQGEETTQEARRGIEAILKGEDDRKLLIVGPCSIHDKVAAYDYAERLIGLAETVSKRILIIQRMYFEKPRTISRPTIEWEGLITDPHGVGHPNRDEGYMLAREIAAYVVNMGMPIATEFVDTSTPRYLNGTIAWAAIGARTIESQMHRHMASGLSMPVGYKNPTSGNELRAIEAYITAFYPGHTFEAISDDGRFTIDETTGNPYGHIVLRGGDNGPNYDAKSVARVQKMMIEHPAYKELGMPPNVLIDCSHGNSNKDHNNQPIVFEEGLKQIVDGKNPYINGWMYESHIKEGSQKLPVPLTGFVKSKLTYGQSVTDSCSGWGTTNDVVMDAYRTLTTKVPVLRRA